jgi:hypothetical protein
LLIHWPNIFKITSNKEIGIMFNLKSLFAILFGVMLLSPAAEANWYKQGAKHGTKVSISHKRHQCKNIKKQPMTMERLNKMKKRPLHRIGNAFRAVRNKISDHRYSLAAAAATVALAGGAMAFGSPGNAQATAVTGIPVTVGVWVGEKAFITNDRLSERRNKLISGLKREYPNYFEYTTSGFEYTTSGRKKNEILNQYFTLRRTDGKKFANHYLEAKKFSRKMINAVNFAYENPKVASHCY